MLLFVPSFHPDENSGVAPLFEAQLVLKVPDMVFTPSLDFGDKGGFLELVEALIDDVFRISSLVPRLAQHKPLSHYQVLVVLMVCRPGPAGYMSIQMFCLCP